MVEVERVRNLMDGVERAVARYQNLENPTIEESAKAFGEVLASVAFYRERLGIT